MRFPAQPQCVRMGRGHTFTQDRDMYRPVINFCRYFVYAFVVEKLKYVFPYQLLKNKTSVVTHRLSLLQVVLHYKGGQMYSNYQSRILTLIPSDTFLLI